MTTVQTSVIFTQNVLLSQYPIAPTFPMSRGSLSWQWRFTRLPSFLVATLLLRGTGQIFCRMFLNWGSSDIFLRMELELRVLGRKPEIKCHCHGPRTMGWASLKRWKQNKAKQNKQNKTNKTRQNPCHNPQDSQHQIIGLRSSLLRRD